MNDSLRESLAYINDLYWLVVIFCVVWAISFFLRPLQTLRDTRDLLKGEYAVKRSAAAVDPDWVDEMWMEDRQ